MAICFVVENPEGAIFYFHQLYSVAGTVNICGVAEKSPSAFSSPASVLKEQPFFPLLKWAVQQTATSPMG